MFNTPHILYMVISGILTAILLVWADKFLKKQRNKDRFLTFFAIATVVIHYSDLWVYYFLNDGQVYITSVHLLPVYPCNVMMWLLLAASLIKNKNCVAFQMLGEFCFIIGTVCGIVGIAFNANYDANPTLTDYGILKGLVSHSTMLVGCLYMLSGDYIRIRLFNIVSVLAGLAVFVLCGIGVNELHDYFGMEAPDGMFLRHNPYFSCSPIWPCIGLLLVLFLSLYLLERYKKKKEVSKSHA